MKSLLLMSLILTLFASCQSSEKSNDYFTRQKIRADEYKARIKAEKRRQAELDLPYRIISLDQKIESLAFIGGTDIGNQQTIWANIEKNRPNLAVLIADAGVSALDPSYRSVREKVPFLAISNDMQMPVSEFSRSWPYIKNVAPTKDSLYHALTFGEKKDTLQVIMLDSRESNDEQWKWLAEELENPVAVSVLVSGKALGSSEKQKFLRLVRGSKQKTIIVLSKDERSFINKSVVNGTSIIELSPRAAATEAVSLGDGPVQVAKAADFGVLRFDWNNRVATLEVRNASDEKVESLETKF